MATLGGTGDAEPLETVSGPAKAKKRRFSGLSDVGSTQRKRYKLSCNRSKQFSRKLSTPSTSERQPSDTGHALKTPVLDARTPDNPQAPRKRGQPSKKRKHRQLFREQTGVNDAEQKMKHVLKDALFILEEHKCLSDVVLFFELM